MLVNLGVPWVILGHSERRALLNEANEVSNIALVSFICLLYGSLPKQFLLLWWCLCYKLMDSLFCSRHNLSFLCFSL